MGRASEYLERKLGFATRFIVNPVTNIVSTTPTLIARANADRLALTVINLSSSNIFVGFDPQVSSSRGILIEGYGGYMTLMIDEVLELVCSEVWAVSSLSDTTIYVLEVEGV